MKLTVLSQAQADLPQVILALGQLALIAAVTDSREKDQRRSGRHAGGG